MFHRKNKKIQQPEPSKDYSSICRLAEQGNVEAQYELAKYYEKGFRVNEDSVLALYWYKKAANNGSANAQFSIGLLYENGFGIIPKSNIKAYEWYLKAAQNGHIEAKKNLIF